MKNNILALLVTTNFSAGYSLCSKTQFAKMHFAKFIAIENSFIFAQSVFAQVPDVQNKINKLEIKK